MNLIQISNVSIRQHNGLYSLNDLHRAAGGENRHKPSLWTSNQQTIELIKEVEKAGNPAILSKQGLGTFVCKELVIHYGMWISPSFSLQVIRTFLAVQEQGSLKSQTTTDQRTPLRQAVSALVGARGIDYSTAYKMVHQRFGVAAIEEIPVDLLPAAVEYVHRLTVGALPDDVLRLVASLLRHLPFMLAYAKETQTAVYSLKPELVCKTHDRFQDGYIAARQLADSLGLPMCSWRDAQLNMFR
jgi:hypothetical protein